MVRGAVLDRNLGRSKTALTHLTCCRMPLRIFCARCVSTATAVAATRRSIGSQPCTMHHDRGSCAPISAPGSIRCWGANLRGRSPVGLPQNPRRLRVPASPRQIRPGPLASPCAPCPCQGPRRASALRPVGSRQCRLRGSLAGLLRANTRGLCPTSHKGSGPTDGCATRVRCGGFKTDHQGVQACRRV